MRLFVAVRPDEPARTAAAALQAEIRAVATLDARWTEPVGLHATLAFLGDVDRATLPDLRDALADAVAPFEPFRVGIGEPGAFPNARRPRVLWIGLDAPAERLTVLAEAVRAALRPFPVEHDERPFRPHMTIARVRVPRFDRALAERLGRGGAAPAAAWEVRSVTLFESVLGPSGARHRPEAELALGRE